MRQIINHEQGSAAWHQHRREHFNASDAPAMLGCSPYKTRSALLHEVATGIVDAEIDAATARRFADGHRFEALARPLAEQIIGEELAPLVLADGKYSASFDGLTFVADVAFEHKTLGNGLREAMREGCTGADLPLHYRAQMEHQAMVSGCERILFMASQWDAEDTLIEERHCWYLPDPELRARIVAGWAQFEADVAAYVPTEPAAPVVAAPTESLPAVVVTVQGALTVAGNLPAFGDALRAFIERIPAKPSTDQEFADAEAACKALKKAEDALAQAEDSALAQIGDVELMRRTVKDLKTLARNTRLATEKLVSAEKEVRKLEIVQQAQKSLIEHILNINRTLQVDGAGYLPAPPAGLFGPCIKGLKSLDSMREKVTAELLVQKTQAGLQAARMQSNRASLRRDDGDWAFMFPDFATVGSKEPEDFAALAQLRITQHQQAEAKRLEAERERIRAEEERKAKEAAERQSVQPTALHGPHGTVAYQADGMPAEGRAKFDHDPRFAAVVAGAPAPQVDEPATLKLRSINERLAPIALTEAGIRSLGIEPAGHDKRAVLYRESQFAGLCDAIARRAMEAKSAALLPT